MSCVVEMRTLLGAVVVTVGLGGGCGPAAVRLVPVQGKVMMEGQPLTTGTLVFKPDAEQGNSQTLEPAANIEADGSYTLYTTAKEGAPLGWYQVGVVANGPANEKDPYAAPKSLIPARYAEVSTSALAVEVVEKPAAGAYDLKLKK